MWQNAVAFARSGQGALAVGLGNILRKSENAELAHRSAELIRFLSGRGVDVSTSIKDVWKRSAFQTVALFAILLAVPAAAVALVFGSWPQDGSSAATYGESPALAVEPDASVHQKFDAKFGPTSAITAEQPHAPIPTCATPPSNGEILTDHRGASEEGHVIEIDNGSEGNAIIKVRNAGTDKTIASFYVQSGQSASLTRVPDGKYRIQYAFGGDLRSDCRSFVDLASAGEFPDQEDLTTRYQEEIDGTRVIHAKLSYTLYDVPGGNVHPNEISPSEFDKP